MAQKDIIHNDDSSDCVSLNEDQLTDEEWLKIRKEAGLRIDPETAEVIWVSEYTLDPYGLYPDLPEEFRQVTIEEFARSPGSDIWVWFGDLPDGVAKKLWEMHS
jgi:hypothetical protein